MVGLLASLRRGLATAVYAFFCVADSCFLPKNIASSYASLALPDGFDSG